MLKLAVCAVMLLLPTAVVHAKPAAGDAHGKQDCAKCHTLSVKEASEMLGFAGISVKSVKPSPSKGLHEVFFEKDGNFGIVFIDFSKRHLIQGAVVDLKTRQAVAAHEKDLPKPKQFAGVDPATIPVKHGFVIGNPKASKTIYVFTDPDCPYCRKLHPVLQQLEKQAPDLAIAVMLYPLKKLHPQAYDKSRTVMAEKKRDLLDKAFEGGELAPPKGDAGKEAIDAVIEYAQNNGIMGTPMILLPNGKPYQGPRDAESIKKAVEGK